MGKKLRKQTVGLVGTSLTLGIGSQVITGAGGSAVALGRVSAFMPSLGVTVGGAAVLRQLPGLAPRRRVVKKRRR